MPETNSHGETETGLPDGDVSTPGGDEKLPPLAQSVEVDGDHFPRFPVKIPVEQHVRNLRRMPMREDDIIIAAFPKCGTHWIWEVAQMLISGKAEHDLRSKEEVMMEFVEVENFHSLPSPRVINSHLFLRQLSTDVVTKKPRVIHVIRNPKDVAVSYFFHITQMKGFETLEESGINEFARTFLQGGLRPGSFFDYFAYLREMRAFLQQHPDVPAIIIYYEDAKEDPVRCVRQLADFLQVEASDQLCAAIADQCSFGKLKQADEITKVKKPIDNFMFKAGQSKLFRKGEVGDWKNYFTVAVSEEFDRQLPEKMKGLDVKMRFTIPSSSS